MFPQHTTRHRGATPLAAMLLVLSAWLPAHSQEEPGQDITVSQTIRRADTEINGWSIALDNDLFGPANTDRDYSGGFGVSIYGARTAKYWWSLDGRTWKLVHTSTPTTFLTPNEIGFFVDPVNSDLGVSLVSWKVDSSFLGAP